MNFTALCTLKLSSTYSHIQHKVGLHLPVLSYQPGPLEELQIGSQALRLVHGNQRKSFLHPVFEAFIEQIAEQKVVLHSSSLSHKIVPTRFVLSEKATVSHFWYG